MICERESDLNTFLGVSKTPISFIIIHDGIKHVVVNEKSKFLGLRFFVSAHNIKRLLPFKFCEIYQGEFKVNITKNWRFVLKKLYLETTEWGMSCYCYFTPSFWPMLVTHGHWAVRVLKRVLPSVLRANPL